MSKQNGFFCENQENDHVTDFEIIKQYLNDHFPPDDSVHEMWEYVGHDFMIDSKLI